MNIIPEVKDFRKQDKIIDCPKSFSVDFSGMEKVKKYALSFISVSDKADSKIVFVKNEELPSEAYNLTVDGTFTVEYSTEEGAFRAMSTLKQVLSEDKLQCGKYIDSPDLKARGVMLDISRSKVPTVKSLCELIDIFADIKYNNIQLYMDAPIFDYAHFKDITKDYEPMTAEELLAVKKYAADKFITLVPNQNSFGHLGAWLKNEKLNPLGITRDDGGNKDTLNPFNPGSLEFVNKLYEDLLPYFDADTVNIGADETTSVGMGETKEASEKTSKTDVYIDYLNQLIELINGKYHMTPMFWDDIVFGHPDKLGRINPNCILLDWAYENESPFSARAKILNEKGLRFYTCPGTSCWGSLAGRLENSLCNIEEAARAAVLLGGEGMLLTEWGDGGNPQFTPLAFTQYVFGACCAWNYNVGPKGMRPRHVYCHTSYRKQKPITDYIEEYMDKFIFKTKGVSGALRRLGNTYILEAPVRFNSVHLYTNIFWPAKEGKTLFLQKEDVENIREYLKLRVAELERFPKDTPWIEEIKFDANLLEITSEYYVGSLEGKHDPKLKDRLLDAKTEFERLWVKSNHRRGVEFFLGKIDEVIARMKV